MPLLLRRDALRSLAVALSLIAFVCDSAPTVSAQFTSFDGATRASEPTPRFNGSSDPAVVLTFTPSDDPEPTTDQRIDDLERQLAELRASLGMPSASASILPAPPAEDFTQPTSLLQAPVPAAKPTAPAGPAAIKYPVINVSGVMQADSVWFLQDSQSKEVLGDAEDFAGFRRARLGVKGQLAENIGYQMEYDFGFPGRPSFMNIYAELQQLPVLGTWRTGQWKQPIHMEAVSSIRELVFMERSLPFGAFVPFRQIGTGVFNTAMEDRITWAASGYRFPSSVFGHVFGDDGYGWCGRATSLLYSDDSINANVHIGGGFSQNRSSTDRLRFRTNPEVGMANQDFNVAAFPLPFFVDTGLFRSNGYNLLDLEFAASVYNVLFMSEWLGVTADQQLGQPTLNFHGGYAQLSYILTGEHRTYNKKMGVFGRVVPDHPFGKAGCGAWELAGRWSYIDLNDRNIQGGRQHDWTFGLNWFPNQYTRFAFNYIHCQVDAPVSGQDVEAGIIATRAQFDF